MAPEIRDQLRRAARDPRADLDPAALRGRVRQLRRRRLGSAVATVALLALLVPLGQAGLERLREPTEVLDRPVAPTPVSTTATTRPAVPAAPRRTPQEVLRALSRLPPGWTDLPRPPAPRARAVSLWTGTHLFFWGGDSGNAGTYHADGWLFDPVARRWHGIARSPLAGRSLAAAVWTGDAVLVWGGSAKGSSRFFNDGAAYDPKTDTWRPLPAAPLSQRTPVATVWTGNEMIVWGSTARAGSDVRDGAAFNPQTSRWRTIAPAPVGLNHAGWPPPSTVWTGQEMVVVGSRLDDNNATTPPWSLYSSGLAYDPAADAWRKLPRVKLSPQASTAVWTGSRVLAWDYDLRAAIYDPKQDAWRRLPGPPVESCSAASEGAASDRTVLAQVCSHALWDIRAGKWLKAEPKKNRYYGHGRVVAAGPVFLIAGANHESNANGLVAYNPR
jgi:Kelch motif